MTNPVSDRVEESARDLARSDDGGDALRAASAGAFTPGPWRIVSDIENQQEPWIESGEHGWKIATLSPWLLASRANARLIATAPELHEVAAMFVRCADRMDDGPDASDAAQISAMFHEAISKARAALAKASGHE